MSRAVSIKPNMQSANSENFKLVHTFRGVAFGNLPVYPSILSHIPMQARRQAQAPFITAVSASGTDDTLSYGELEYLTRRAGSWLSHNYGIGRGDVVALMPKNDIPSVVAILGFLRAGCTLLLLNPADPVGRLQQQAEGAGAKAVFHAPIPTHSVPDAASVPDLGILRAEGSRFLDVPLSPGADALMFGTSGSTAASKIVVQSHGNATVNAEAVRRHHELRNEMRLLGCLPIHHVNGVHFTLFATLASGSHAILADAFHPLSYPKLIERFQPHIASVVPSILESLVEVWRRPRIPTAFNYFVSAAAPLNSRTVRAVREKLGCRVIQGYGLSETTNFSATMPPRMSEATYRRFADEAEIPSIGCELFGNEIAVLTSAGEDARPGEIGEICMRGHNVMIEYRGNAVATREAFRNGWFHSQDLGYAVADPDSGQTFFVITGRAKNIAKIGGENVSLDEMDRVLRGLAHIQDAACIALQHRFWGDEIIAAVVLSAEVSDRELLEQLRAHFSANVVPRRIVRLPAIPRTPTGKVRRPDLAQQLASIVEEASQIADSNQAL